MIKRVLIGVLALAVVVAGSFVGYGYWTRRGAPTFSRGGVFEAEPTPARQPQHGKTKVAAGKAKDRQRSSVSDPNWSETSVPTTGPVATNYGIVVSKAAIGAYSYEGTGFERVNFGGASACSWDIDEVSLSVRKDPAGRIFDWTYSDQHVERHVVSYRDDGMYTEFLGSAVTCVGVRKTSEDTYDPPALRLPFPVRAGDTWTERSSTEERDERIRGEILRRKRITVPAGTFEVYVVHIEGTLSGSQTGTFETTRWISADLGITVMEDVRTDVDAGSAKYIGEMHLELASLP